MISNAMVYHVGDIGVQNITFSQQISKQYIFSLSILYTLFSASHIATEHSSVSSKFLFKYIGCPKFFNLT